MNIYHVHKLKYVFIGNCFDDGFMFNANGRWLAQAYHAFKAQVVACSVLAGIACPSFISSEFSFACSFLFGSRIHQDERRRACS